MPWQLILEISQDWFSCWISRVEFVSPSPFFLVIHFCSLLLYVDAGSASTWGMAGVSAGNAKASSHTVVVQGSFPTVALFGEMTVCVLSLSVVSNSVRPLGLWPTRLLCPWGFSRQEYWSGLPSRGSSQSRAQTQVFCIAGGFFTVWATREICSLLCATAVLMS